MHGPLNSKARYALRALVLLARSAPEPLGGHAIAEGIAAPRKFVEAILGELVGGQLVESQRGRGGGYRLARAPQAVTVADVLEAIRSKADLPVCARFERSCRGCGLPELCRIRAAFEAAHAASRAILAQVTLVELADHADPSTTLLEPDPPKETPGQR